MHVVASAADEILVVEMVFCSYWLQIYTQLNSVPTIKFLDDTILETNVREKSVQALTVFVGLDFGTVKVRPFRKKALYEQNFSKASSIYNIWLR